MKRILDHFNKISQWATLVCLALTIVGIWGCKDETTDLPPRAEAEDIAEIAETYDEILTAETEGWVLVYKPEAYNDSVYIQLWFQPDRALELISGYRGFHTRQSGKSYHYEGAYQPIVVFDDTTVFTALADEHNGSKKFKINYVEDREEFELTRSDGYNDIVFTLKKADEESLRQLDNQVQDILDLIAWEEEQERLSQETMSKFRDFVAIESDFYFYNLTTENFSAAVNELDTVNRSLELTYKQTPLSPPSTTAVNYTFYPEGIIFNPPIEYGSLKVDTLKLGEVGDVSMEILSAGNTGSGSIGYSHEAPYLYTNVADRTQTAAAALYTYIGSSNLLYTANTDDYFSTETLSLRSELREVFRDKTTDLVDERFNLQLYFKSSPTSTPSLQLSSRKSEGGNSFYLLSHTVVEPVLEDNVLQFELTGNASSNVVNTGVRDDYEAFYREIFPEEGVTVVPYRVGTTTRYRLVSKKDSRIWVNYVHQVAAQRSLVFD
ncbi:DUF4302 domain-containing protein [Sinomicrobium sp.]